MKMYCRKKGPIVLMIQIFHECYKHHDIKIYLVLLSTTSLKENCADLVQISKRQVYCCP